MRAKLAPFCRRVLAVGSELPDLYPDQGPLGGLLTALAEAQEHLLVVPVDVPLLRAETLRALVEARGPRPVVARHQRLEPLIGVYPAAAQPLLKEVFQEGERAVHRALARLEPLTLEFEPEQFLNVNSAQDLERAEALFKRGV